LGALRTWMRAAGISGVGMAALDAPPPSSGLIIRSNREARAFTNTPATAPQGDDLAQLEVRFFADATVVCEDPVTGSFNASLAQWLIAEGHAPTRYIACQGTCIGREGRVHIDQDSAGQVWVGGDALTCIDGAVLL
jgi:PhzF family phenazine biosynthesis protein